MDKFLYFAIGTLLVAITFISIVLIRSRDPEVVREDQSQVQTEDLEIDPRFLEQPEDESVDLANQVQPEPDTDDLIVDELEAQEQVGEELPISNIQRLELYDYVPSKSDLSYRLTEVAQHNTSQDCWVVISDNVYDVTELVFRYPTGQLFADYCGQIADAFYQGLPENHQLLSNSAKVIINTNKLGDLL